MRWPQLARSQADAWADLPLAASMPTVRGPKHVVKTGKTSVLTADEARLLLNAIDTSTLTGLRDRALIGVMDYTFTSVNAVISMTVKDYFTQGRRG